MGGREREEKRESVEWERRNEQVGEELLGGLSQRLNLGGGKPPKSSWTILGDTTREWRNKGATSQA